MAKDRKRVIKRGSVKVNIYPTKGAYTICWHEGEGRKRIRRTDYDEAVLLAEEIATRLHNGRADGHQLTGEDKRVYLDLQARTRKIGCTLTEAVELLERFKSALGHKISTEQAIQFYQVYGQEGTETRTVNEAYEEFLTEKEARTSRRNVEGLKLHVGRFTEEMGDSKLASITHRQIEKHLDSKGHKPAYFNNARAEIITFFRWCRKHRYLPQLPTEAERVEKRTQVVESVKVFTPEQFSALLNHVRKDLVPYLVVSAFGGLRPSEAARLEWQHVRWDQEYIEIEATVARKTLRDRFVPLNETLRAWLSPYRREEGLVCQFRRPNEMLTRELAKLREAGDFDADWPPDVLRHSYGSYRLVILGNISQLAEEMGKSPNVIKEHYRRPVMRDEADAWFAVLPRSGC